MSLNTFISEISRNSGLARTSRFRVELTPPEYVFSGIPGGNQNLKMLTLFCDTAQLPGVNFATNQVKIYGEAREMPYEIMYEPVTLTFYVDNNLYVKRFFDEWINGIHNGATRDSHSRNLRYYAEYAKRMTIIIESIEDKQVHVVHLHEAYPKSVSGISLDYASKDVMKLNVTMQYKYWTSGELDQSSPDITTIPADYYDKFFDYQQYMNLNFSFPETSGAITGVTPIEF